MCSMRQSGLHSSVLTKNQESVLTWTCTFYVCRYSATFTIICVSLVSLQHGVFVLQVTDISCSATFYIEALFITWSRLKYRRWTLTLSLPAHRMGYMLVLSPNIGYTCAVLQKKCPYHEIPWHKPRFSIHFHVISRDAFLWIFFVCFQL